MTSLPAAAARWHTALLLLSAILLLALGSPAFSQSAPSSSAAVNLTRVELRKVGERLQLHFLFDGPTEAKVVGNIRRKVVVVKFRNVRAAFPNDQRVFAYNDPMVEGIAFEEVAAGQTWAKIRLRHANLRFEQVPAPSPNQIVIALRTAPPIRETLLTGVRLGKHQGASQMVLDLTRSVTYEAARQGNQYLIRLKDVRADLGAPPKIEDDRVRLLAVDSDGADLLVRLELKDRAFRVIPRVLDDPPRLALSIRLAARQVPRVPGTVAEEPPPPLRAPRAESLEALLAEEENPAIRANFILAEREYRAGRFRAANEIFLRVYQAAKRRKLGVRSYFRAADAQYELLRIRKSTRYHGVIGNYQAAVRAAEAVDYESDLIPRAFFQIARSYQHMRFDFEANVNYQILQERFPDNTPYTPDSYYYRGVTFLEIRQFKKGIASFRHFLEIDGDPGLEAPALYNLGDTFYNLKRFPEAKRSLDAARRIDPEYPNAHPILLFHMGEAYYENAEFDVARLIYRILLERYPNKGFTKLVALRLGDFLREEGKLNDALAIYRQVLQGSPLPIKLRARMRIANLLARRPGNSDYQESITHYDDVVREGVGDPIVEEARLRKALTLTLHNQHQKAIDAFEDLVSNHPNSPFVRKNIVEANIQENLKSLIDGYFSRAEYWEIARIYTRYRDRYFRNFQFKFTLFQVADSYQQLGLFDDSARLYDGLLSGNSGDLKPLIAYRRALSFFERDDLGRAEDELLRFIQEYQGESYLTDARMALGEVYFTGRRYSDALNAYKILVQEFEKKPEGPLGESIGEVYHRLGIIYRELGQMKNAADAFDAAIENFHHPIQGELVPEFIILSHFMAGDSLFDLEQNQEAIAAFEDGIRLYPNHDKAPWARFQIGLIYRRTGQERKALETFNVLVDLARVRPGELWEPLARENQRDLVNALEYQKYLKQ